MSPCWPWSAWRPTGTRPTCCWRCSPGRPPASGCRPTRASSPGRAARERSTGPTNCTSSCSTTGAATCSAASTTRCSTASAAAHASTSVPSTARPAGTPTGGGTRGRWGRCSPPCWPPNCPGRAGGPAPPPCPARGPIRRATAPPPERRRGVGGPRTWPGACRSGGPGRTGGRCPARRPNASATAGAAACEDDVTEPGREHGDRQAFLAGARRRLAGGIFTNPVHVPPPTPGPGAAVPLPGYRNLDPDDLVATFATAVMQADGTCHVADGDVPDELLDRLAGELAGRPAVTSAEPVALAGGRALA